MLHEAVIKNVLLCFSFYIMDIECHLKDLGESTKNWTNIMYRLEHRIVGGSDASLDEFPFSVQFFNYGGLCGGSILTKKVVLTAAHCFDYHKNLAEMKIFTKPRFVFDGQAKWYDVWDFEVHKDYGQQRVFSNDIALVLIHNDFAFGFGLARARVTYSDVWMKPNETVVVNGWGETKYGEFNDGLKRNTLKKADLYFVSRQRCMALNQVVLAPEMFCLHGDGVRDTCRGDSGGGVLWNGHPNCIRTGIPTQANYSECANEKTLRSDRWYSYIYNERVENKCTTGGPMMERRCRNEFVQFLCVQSRVRRMNHWAMSA